VLRDGESIVTLETAKTSKREVIRHMVGREITDLFPRRTSHPGKTLLSVKGLNVDHDGHRVLSDISFEVRAGEVLGIGGLMGSGRSELLMHLFGAFGQRAGGEVLLGTDGRLESNTPSESIRRGLVLVTEDRKRYGLILPKPIGFNLSLSSLRSVTSAGLVDANREFTRNKTMFDSLRVKAPTLEAAVGKLSGGNQQKVVLGKALLTSPNVIFLDEPTRGIDVGAKLEVYELVNRLTEQGQAVVLVSSELPELMGMSDRIVMLHEGAVGGTFDRATATQENLLAAAMGHGPAVAGKSE
jgi:D-xylose transport system ATP-binding protein